MTDLSALTVDQLAEKVRESVWEIPRNETHEWEAKEALFELVRRASERDQAVLLADREAEAATDAATAADAAIAERDQAVRRVKALEAERKVDQREIGDLVKEADSYKAERDRAVRERNGAREALESNAPLILDLTQRADRLAAALEDSLPVLTAYDYPGYPPEVWQAINRLSLARDALAADQEQT